MAKTKWKQGDLVETVITDLSDTGDGVGRSDELVVFVPDTVPGDRVVVRLVNVKPKYAFGKVKELLQSSPHRIRPACIVADKCGGCQWQHINYEYQLVAKRKAVVQALQRIGGFADPQVDAVLTAGRPLDYRNKATYPMGISPTVGVIAGYYQKSSHQIVNLNQCPVQDSRLDPFLAQVKKDIQSLGWEIYNEHSHTGIIRHLGLRIGRRTGEVLLTLVVRDWNIPGIEQKAQEWLDHYPPLVGVMLNRNSDRTNAIFGSETRLIAGTSYLQEEFASLKFQIRPETFFQVNTETAEALLYEIQSELNLQGNEILVDAYCGIGTLTLPLSLHVHLAIGLEIQQYSVVAAQINAQYNHINNVTFHSGKVEELLSRISYKPDIVILDPPRKGCEPTVIETLRKVKPARIVYMSCKAATLARDLRKLCQDGLYTLLRVQPADFFPQTSHVEVAAFLVRSDLVKDT
ncbi:23S rRNA (uracil(1939)-C(5))-methyltransferase RlmD [Rivularia sp. UHCC 0363]|uniref:23S rRNA (uracil(1939)-C(5))-methyltransferase RlmD n=1 Tax=Rivularia sp. UHCC 0363 TaxID=3110244 RepID=UPI002B219804|nr:23S rRNA (uracil(1939)-C(5))-methyltransferase RlmD [Rivularia sp. UHCC 0363]MEA5595299.1 23S rRNA (uracil(1939)-C(5))-methyltransferase RlmD [Rivularia sp. UHCC 0363]